MSNKVGLDTRKPVSEFWNQVMFKPACSATETSQNIEILLVASSSFQRVNSKGADQTVIVQAGLHLCCLHTTKSGYIVLGP